MTRTARERVFWALWIGCSTRFGVCLWRAIHVAWSEHSYSGRTLHIEKHVVRMSIIFTRRFVFFSLWVFRLLLCVYVEYKCLCFASQQFMRAHVVYVEWQVYLLALFFLYYYFHLVPFFSSLCLRPHFFSIPQFFFLSSLCISMGIHTFIVQLFIARFLPNNEIS